MPEDHGITFKIQKFLIGVLVWKNTGGAAQRSIDEYLAAYDMYKVMVQIRVLDRKYGV